MKERLLRALAILLAASLAGIGHAQGGADELRDLKLWSGDTWQRLRDMPIAATVRDGHPVTAMHAKTGAGVAGDIFVVALSCVDRATHEFLDAHFAHDKLPLLVSRFGTRYRTDERGYARVALPPDGILLAVCGQRIGQRRPQQDRTFIPTREHVAIRAEVVDEDGMPLAAVPVKAGHVSNQSQVATGCSDAAGRVSLRVAKSLLRQQLLVETKIAGPKRGTILVPGDYFGTKPTLLQIRAPRTGQVHASIEDPIGVLPKTSSQARLTWQGDRSSLAGTGIAPSKWHEGTAIFAHVEPGLTVTAKMTHGSRMAFTTSQAGPAAAGATAQLAVTVDDDQFVLRGRLLGDHAAGKHHVRISCLESVQNDQFVLGADGRFLLAIDNARFPYGDVRFEFFAASSNPGQPGLVAIASVTNDQRGVVDFGDLKMQRERVLVRGRLMRAGKPLAAQVSAPLGSSPDGAIAHRTRSGKDGRFVIFEAGPATGELELTVQHGWPPTEEKVKATIGEAEQVFQVSSGRSLTFTVKDRRFLSMFRFVARANTAGVDPVNGFATADGFRFENLSPGAHRVTVTLGSCELARIDDIDADTKPTDPRCRDLEWLQQLRTAKLVITDKAGKPLRAHCYVATGKKKNSLWRVANEEGHVELPYLDGHRIFIRQGQHRTEIVTPTAELQTVRMQRRTALQLRLPDGLKLPGSAEMHFDSEAAEFGLKDHVHRWRPGQPNVVPVEAWKRTVLRVRMRNLRGQYETLHEQTIELPDTAEPLEVVVGIDEDDASFALDIETARATIRRGREP